MDSNDDFYMDNNDFILLSSDDSCDSNGGIAKNPTPNILQNINSDHREYMFAESSSSSSSDVKHILTLQGTNNKTHNIQGTLEDKKVFCHSGQNQSDISTHDTNRDLGSYEPCDINLNEIKKEVQSVESSTQVISNGNTPSSHSINEKRKFNFSKLGATTSQGANSSKNDFMRASMNSPPIFVFESKVQKNNHLKSPSRNVRTHPYSPSRDVKTHPYSPSRNVLKQPNSDVDTESEIQDSAASSSTAINSPAPGSLVSNEYEVEEIVDHEELTPGRLLYKVKFKGFDDTGSTWEPLEHLTSCMSMVYNYKRRQMSRNQNPVEQRFQRLIQFLSQHDEAFLSTFVQRFCNDQGVMKVPKIDIAEIHGYVRYFARHPELIKSNEPELNYLREHLLTSIVYERRQAQLEDLKNYETEINVTAGNTVAPIYVINNVDLEVVPRNFTHTSVNIPTQGVIVNEEPIIWCECEDNCKDSESCCGQMNDSENAYDKNKILAITHGTPIFECNKNCRCNDTCPNRVVQLGTQKKIAIFKTYNDCGWGLQTLEFIPKGTFVTEYLGEILTFKAASTRVNQTYLFNLDFNGSIAYVIDAGTYGNISHFINHSCDPNLAVFAAYIQCLDPNLHRLPLFSIRDIQKGEQLSFSYHTSAGAKTGSKKIKCKCDAKACRGYLAVD